MACLNEEEISIHGVTLGISEGCVASYVGDKPESIRRSIAHPEQVQWAWIYDPTKASTHPGSVVFENGRVVEIHGDQLYFKGTLLKQGLSREEILAFFPDRDDSYGPDFVFWKDRTAEILIGFDEQRASSYTVFHCSDAKASDSAD